ncbi:MAG: LPS assembly protein LptD [Gammaproteobacteria bacterium]|nr:LPS assembly protein LptD [Gammaproteobacteria bacterium]MCW9004330.1 LPS assembly protein LptD [Gammaproteobacteria bacterium]
MAESTIDVNQWQNCPASTGGYQSPAAFPEDKKDETRISAKQVQNAAGDITIFTDDVVIERDKLKLRADQVIFDRPNQKLDIQGNIHIDAENMGIDSEGGWLQLDSNLGEFTNSQYFVPDSHYRGRTPDLSLQGKKQTLLINSSFTSCPENNEDWSLDTSLLKLNHETQTGTAKHAVLWFKNIPIFYTPYISFPLGDERRSGFLMPQFGTSSSRGGELGIPWYWNIAPNQDAIITPRVMKKRGTQIKTDYRYLTQNSNGQMNIEYLDKDKQLKDKRYLVKFNNHSDIGEHLDFDILINDASDSNYFEDLGSSIAISNTTHLERNSCFNYAQGIWTTSLFAQTYETIDQAIALINRPYRRLPQLTITGKDNLFDSDFTWSLNSEWVDFDHESDSKIKGQRFDIQPKVSWPLMGNAWFFTPSAGFEYSSYTLTDATGNPISIEDRSISISSIDTGLFFEREVSGHYIQTLEPRLYYLYIPYKDQSNIPLFDTGEYDFSFAHLFRENRFTGIDRIGDSNQVTLALSSRLLDKNTGSEFLSLSIGQIFYDEDRQVTLDNTVATNNQSDVISELSGQRNNFKSRATVQWNPETREADRQSFQINYKNDARQIVNLGYRFRRDPVDETNNLEQTDFSFNWPINNQYSIFSRWNRSLTEKRDIETLFGIEYDSCCWSMRILGQRYLKTTDTNDFHDSSIMFQLILKGLGSVSDKEASNIIKHAILGYQSDY